MHTRFGSARAALCAALACAALPLVALLEGASADEAAQAPRPFASPEAAIQAMTEALEANDDAALKALVGSACADMVQDGKDPVVAHERRRVAQAARAKVAFEDLADGGKVAVLGFQAWPLPLPLVAKDGSWSFDALSGRDEVLARMIGDNELRVMDLMRMLVEAQEAYAAKDRDGDGVLEYAQRMTSTPGAKDGLVWKDPADVALEDRSPLGPTVAGLTPFADAAGPRAPYSGYVFRILTGQGPSAPTGAHSFLEGENLTRGFAVLAIPAEYKRTGVKSFLISHRGRLFERDLGVDGAQKAQEITVFEPDATWFRVGDP